MRTRAYAVAAVLSLMTATGGGVALAAAAPAAAATSHGPVRTTGLTTNIPCTVAGQAQTCSLAVTSFAVVNGALQAAGSVTAPVALVGGATSVPFTAPVIDPASCQILSLTLGPLHVDLLGLVVDLNQVNLNVTAQPGPGNLLGNLLCAVTNLLNNTGGLGNAITNLLTIINGILSGL